MSKTRVRKSANAAGSPAVALDLVVEAAQDGAADAREAAIRTWNATAQYASRFAYITCYAVSYGVVFPAVFLAHSIPRNNEVVRGLIDGAQAAIQKVGELRSNSSQTSVPALAPA